MFGGHLAGNVANSFYILRGGRALSLYDIAHIGDWLSLMPGRESIWDLKSFLFQ